MSGSDPSVSRVRASRLGGSEDGGHDKCPGRAFESVLGSPIPEVVATLDENDLLDIRAVDDPVRGVVAETLDGKLVGAVTRDILHLRSCMAEGWAYEAEVLRVLGGSVSVLIRASD